MWQTLIKRGVFTRSAVILRQIFKFLGKEYGLKYDFCIFVRLIVKNKKS